MAYFFAIEGPDGSGKSTVINALKNKLSNHINDINIVVTREPGGNHISESIRNIILDPNNTDMAPTCEALLYAASRAQHVQQTIKPVIDDKRTVILCDRFIDSSLVYQGIGRKLGIDQILEINLFATQNILPYKTIFLDLKPEIGLMRINSDANREYNRLDMEKIEFHNSVYKGYLKLIENSPERFKVFNADQEIDTVVDQVFSYIIEVLDYESK